MLKLAIRSLSHSVIGVSCRSGCSLLLLPVVVHRVQCPAHPHARRRLQNPLKDRRARVCRSAVRVSVSVRANVSVSVRRRASGCVNGRVVQGRNALACVRLPVLVFALAPVFVPLVRVAPALVVGVCAQ